MKDQTMDANSNEPRDDIPAGEPAGPPPETKPLLNSAGRPPGESFGLDLSDDALDGRQDWIADLEAQARIMRRMAALAAGADTNGVPASPRDALAAARVVATLC